MTKKLEIYKCNICGNLVQVLLNGVGELVCCNHPMELKTVQNENSLLGEKHAPKIEFKDNKKFVQVISHPMSEEHYIQFLEVYKNDKSELHIKFFEPNVMPEMDISYLTDDTYSIEYCNIHGLWGESKND